MRNGPTKTMACLLLCFKESNDSISNAVRAGKEGDEFVRKGNKKNARKLKGHDPAMWFRHYQTSKVK